MSRRRFLKASTATATLAGMGMPALAKGAVARRPNVLFLSVDDLRPQLGCYGHAQMTSPHMDALAGAGTLFGRAYCQVPVCGASRASLLSGLRPTCKRFIDYDAHMDRDAQGVRSLPDHFKANGYHTESIGKIYHNREDDLDGWSLKPYRIRMLPGTRGIGYRSQENWGILESRRGARSNHGWKATPWEATEADDADYPDGALTNHAIQRMNQLVADDQPFFLAVGLHKPHLPFNCPQKYWDLYDRDSIDLADNPFRPKGAPDAALHNWGELRSYAGIPPEGALDEDTARSLIHGYYACVSYADAMVGKLLAALEKTGQADNTIVILWGDHGWQLGEHGLWCKHANFETSLHCPLMIKAPGLPASKTQALTEFVDIYPTLCDLAELDKPGHLEGTSLVPLMAKPDRSWKPAVFSRFKSGDSVKTNRYRYTRYVRGRGEKAEISEMLYDHEADPGENVNIADSNAGRPIAAEMVKLLEAGWRLAKPVDV